MRERSVKVIDLDGCKGYQRLVGGEPISAGMKSGKVYLQPGEECGWHSTDDHEETIVFLCGAGKAFTGDDGEFHEVGEGKVSYIPPETRHNILNTGEGPLVYVYCASPACSR